MNRFNISGKIGSAGVNHLPKADTSNEPKKPEQEQDIEETVFRPKKEKRKKLKFQRDE